MNIALIILIIAHFLFYILSCYLIIKKRNRTTISIRSPLLILINNISGCILSSMLIFYILNPSSSSSPNKPLMIFFSFFYLFQVIMIISIVFRYQRIMSCCQIKGNERIDIRNFITKRHLYQIRYYLKILLAITITVALLITLIDIFMDESYINIFYPSMTEHTPQFTWLIINFLQVLILMTYYRIMKIYDLSHSLHVEAALFSLFWMVIANGITLHHLFKREDHLFILISLGGFYGCLFVNGVLPVILSFIRRNNIGYHFNPKLMNNLYLFLSNEYCYMAFRNFVFEVNKDRYYLELYTAIMRLKLQLRNREEYDDLKENADNICQIYLNSTSMFLDSEVIQRTKDEYEKMMNGDGKKKEFNSDVFDEVLTVTFAHLTMRFSDFKVSPEYNELTKLMSLHSYLQCKMHNIRLVNDA